MKKLDFYLADACKKDYVIGAYNFYNLETLKGICEGCARTKSPAFIALSEGGFSYIGENFIIPMVETVKKQYKIPLFLHLDHGKSFEMCKKAVDLGFDSVMFDGSSLPFEENVKQTAKVVNYAHKKGVFVEAELGVLAGVEDTVSADKSLFTDPEKAKEFVSRTGCDSLAVAIGTSHGAYKYKTKQQIQFGILSEIEKNIPSTPLVLHGASSVPAQFVKTINQFGGHLEGAAGTKEATLRKLATQHHIYKINTDTDIRLCYMAAVRKFLAENPSEIDLRKANKVAIQEIANFVADKNEKVFNCKNRI